MSQENSSDLFQSLRDRFAQNRGSVSAAQVPVVGTTGDDTLMGTVQNDVLIGSGGSDQIKGGAGDDVVISADPLVPPVPMAAPVAAPVVAPVAVPVVMPTVEPLMTTAAVPPVTPVPAMGEMPTAAPDPIGIVNPVATTVPVNGVDGAAPAIPDGVVPVTADQLNSFFDGTDGVDVLLADTAKAPVAATAAAGDDQITTGLGADIIDAGAGNDFIDANAGADTIYAGVGDDRIVWNTGDGSDVINGGDGTDISETTGGADPEFFSLSMKDNGVLLDRFSQKPFTLDMKAIEQVAINGKEGADVLDINQLTGSGVQEVKFDGGVGNDILAGTGSSVSLLGIGGEGDDFFAGGTVSDTFKGDAGNDTFAGGGGADRFLFDTGAVFETAQLGIDNLADFQAGTDKVVLNKGTFAALQSEGGEGFSQAKEFGLVASDDLADLSESLIVYSSGSGKLFYNSNGVEAGLGRGAEFATLQGNPQLTAADFSLEAAHPSMTPVTA